MLEIAERLSPSLSINLEGNSTSLKKVLSLTTQNEELFANIPSNAIFVIRNCNLPQANLSNMALSPHIMGQSRMHLTMTEMREKFLSLPKVFLRNFHNDDAVNVMIQLKLHTSYTGWFYEAERVYRLRAEMHNQQMYVHFEKEPSEYLLDITKSHFLEFRNWVTQRTGVVFNS